MRNGIFGLFLYRASHLYHLKSLRSLRVLLISILICFWLHH